MTDPECGSSIYISYIVYIYCTLLIVLTARVACTCTIFEVQPEMDAKVHTAWPWPKRLSKCKSKYLWKQGLFLAENCQKCMV